MPAAVLDQRFDLIFAAAVFIHCPRSVIEAYLRQVPSVAKPGAVFRFQVCTDPADPSELIPLEAIAPEAARAAEDYVEAVEGEHAASGEAEHIEDAHYQGHNFKMAELHAMIEAAFPNAARVVVLRFDPLLANCEVVLG